MDKITYRIPENAVEDALAFRREVERFISGQTSATAFKALRVPMGIYEQRESDTYMVRIRGAAGIFLPHQANLIADLAEKFGDGKVHVTTRQDLQIHRVLIQDTPVILERLIEAGLSTRGGGGNTVRNISACPHAGVCRDEAFDVSPYALALTEYLIIDRANFNLPRKFKVAFSGCGQDCSLASVTDLGFFAHSQSGIHGFSVYAGGGMGAHSTIGVLIEDFIPAQELFEVAEAVKRLFDKYGDRTNRHKARLRFVLERFGTEEFRRLYKLELEQVRLEGISTPRIKPNGETASKSDASYGNPHNDHNFLVWRSKYATSQKQANLYMTNVPLELGLITSSSLKIIADAASQIGNGTLRTTQQQGLQLRNVPESRLYDLYKTLQVTGISFPAIKSVKCVACTGASTCRLGLCLSRGLATAIEAEFSEIEFPFEVPIKISGCPNSCGHHPIAPIGLHGGASRAGGRLFPVYFLYAGGKVGEGAAKLGQLVAKIPAKAVPALLREFCMAATKEHRASESLDELLHRWGIDHLGALAEKYKQNPSYEDSPEFYRDFGCAEDFSPARR